MSIVKTAFRAGIWYSGFTTVSQVISWCATLVVARLLMPEDYGLMAMATILTGYVQVFYTMGVGSAIVQRQEITDDELSSLFWALLFWGSVLSLVCFLLAYPTVLIFGEPRIFRVTQAVSVLFVLGTVFVVPSTLLTRQLRFKSLGVVKAVAVVISCLAMIAMAYFGAGVWTLLGGQIINATLMLILAFSLSGWRPKFRFRHQETIPYLRFGLPVVGATSLRYLYFHAPVFFGGRVLSTSGLGQYSLACQLAIIPNDKILALVNSIAYPVLARMQTDDWEFKRFYLRLSRLVAFIMLPLYCGGIFLAGDVLPWVLGEQWRAAVLPFQWMCVAFLFLTLSTPSHVANIAQGYPQWVFWFHVFCAAAMPGAFYLAAGTGSLAYLTLPWLVIYAPAQVVFSWLTLRKLGIPVRDLAAHLQFPVLVSLSMLLVLAGLRYGFTHVFVQIPTTGVVYVLSTIAVGALWYTCWALLLQRSFLWSIVRLARAR